MKFSKLMTQGWETDWSILTSFRTCVALLLDMDTLVFLHMILLATRCKSGILKPSLTLPVAPFPNTLLTVYFLVREDGKLSVCPWFEINMKTFLLAPAKQISELWSKGIIRS